MKIDFEWGKMESTYIIPTIAFTKEFNDQQTNITFACWCYYFDVKILRK